jgi:hypothetical protein
MMIEGKTGTCEAILGRGGGGTRWFFMQKGNKGFVLWAD